MIQQSANSMGAVLSDRDIKKSIELGYISIAPFEEELLTPNGYDLRIGEISIPEENVHLRNGKIKISSGTRFLIGTLEEVYVDTQHVAQLWLKSKWARRGVMASFGLVDSGFKGILTIGAYATGEVELSVNDKFVQICFINLSSPVEKTYEKRSGNYQNQKNIKI